MAKWNAALACAGAAVAAATCAIGLTNCSSSSGGSAGGSSDASSVVNFDALPPLGVGVEDCGVGNCPLPASCGGALLGPSTGVSYCTLTCASNSDCPPGTVCEMGKIPALYGGHCLKSCTTDTDCSGGFACSKTLSVCWSPYNGADAVPDAGGHTPEAAAETGAGGQDGAADTGAGGQDGAAAEAGSGAEGGSDGGTPEASSEAGD